MSERAGLDYCIVGGAAAQIWNASLLTGNGKVSLDRQPELAFRLRTTRDIDVSTESDPSDMLQILNGWASLGKAPISVLSPRAIKLREILINITLEPADVTGFVERYHQILANSSPLQLRKGNRLLSVRVEALEDLMATKLTRKGNQAKDLVDLDNLLTSLREARRTADLASLRSWLREDSGALALLESYQDEYPEAFN